MGRLVIDISIVSFILATVLTIAVNAMAEIIPLNGMTVADISNKFGTYFVPAGYVFAIWGIIYLLLLGFSFGLGLIPKKSQAYVETIFPWYVLSCLLNCIWIIFWHYELIYASVLIIISLLTTLAIIYRTLLQNPPKTLLEKIVVHIPFYVYIGWVSVATIANISDALWLANWSGFGLSGQHWASIMMIIAGTLAGYITLTTIDLTFGLVVIWALVGIMAKFPSEISMVFAGSIAILFVAVSWIYRVFLGKRSPKLKS